MDVENSAECGTDQFLDFDDDNSADLGRKSLAENSLVCLEKTQHEAYKNQASEEDYQNIFEGKRNKAKKIEKAEDDGDKNEDDRAVGKEKEEKGKVEREKEKGEDEEEEEEEEEDEEEEEKEKEKVRKKKKKRKRKIV